ncbi:MAG: GAF domain-containing protein, partial [Pseudomonadota bacterium]
RAGSPVVRAMVDDSNIRSVLFVPLISGGRAIGLITLFRTRVAAFAVDEIALVEAFATQAVIAIKTVQHFKELQARLDRETATGDVLQAISQSRADHQQVFDTLLNRAVSLLESDHGSVWLVSEDGNWVETVARKEDGAEVGATFDRRPMAQADSVAATVVREARMWRTDDLKADADFADPNHPNRVWIAQSGARSILMVPLVSNGVGAGFIAVYRRHVGPYSDDDAALLQTFAAQAVIAIENVRQFREVQERTAEVEEALEYQTATSEVLDVISRSPDQFQGVLEAIIDVASRLCQNPEVFVALLDPPTGHFNVVASKNMNPELLAIFESTPIVPSEASVTGRTALTGLTTYVADITKDTGYGWQAVKDIGYYRSVLSVPLFKDGMTVGTITLGRAEPSAFSPKQITLMETFAAQAVIAIGNARLFDEVQQRTKEVEEALVREQASAEILQVINEATSDLQPVFDLIVQKSAELCGAKFCVLDRFDGTHYQFCAQHGFPPKLAADLLLDYPFTEAPGHVSCQVVGTGRVVHIEDAQNPDLYYAPHLARDVGWRRMLGVPIKADGRTWGAVIMAWPHTGSPPIANIELVQSFANQASIAIENARLLSETQTALVRQTASADILRVISETQSDLNPVFDAILSRAATLCDAPMASLNIVNPERTHANLVAHHGDRLQALEVGKTQWPLDDNLSNAVAIRDKQAVQIADLMDTDLYRDGNDIRRHAVDDEGVRTFLAVPLIHKGEGIGSLALYKREVKPFTQEDIALLESFADQAVIAIQNARLFNETQSALVRQTASADILRVISGAQTDVLPVFEAICTAATSLLASDLAFVMTSDGETYSPVAGASPAGILDDLGPQNIPVDPAQNFPSRVIRNPEVLHLPDWTAIDLPPHERLVHETFGVQSALYVPLMSKGKFLGLLVFARSEAKAYS